MDERKGRISEPEDKMEELEFSNKNKYNLIRRCKWYIQNIIYENTNLRDENLRIMDIEKEFHSKLKNNFQ